MTNLTSWLVKCFDSKRSLHLCPGVEGHFNPLSQAQLIVGTVVMLRAKPPGTSSSLWVQALPCSPRNSPESLQDPFGEEPIAVLSENLSVPCPFISPGCGCGCLPLRLPLADSLS